MKTVASFSFVVDEDGAVTAYRELGFSELIHEEAYGDGWEASQVAAVWDRCLALLGRGFALELVREDSEVRGTAFVCITRNGLRRQMADWSQATQLPA